MPVPLSKLSKSDLITLLEVVDRSLSVQDQSSMIALLRHLSAHLPTDGVAAGLIPSHLWGTNAQATNLASGRDSFPRKLRTDTCAPADERGCGSAGKDVLIGGVFVITNLNNSGFSEAWLTEYVSNLLENGALTLRDLKTLQGAARGGKNGHSRGGKRA